MLLQELHELEFYQTLGGNLRADRCSLASLREASVNGPYRAAGALVSSGGEDGGNLSTTAAFAAAKLFTTGGGWRFDRDAFPAA